MSTWPGMHIDDPAGALFDIADEWGAGWGRADEQLAEVVRSSREEQLRA